jgi:hypothetical protein
MSNEAAYLVQTEDKRLHAYYSLIILLFDLNVNRNEPVQIYRRSKSFCTVKYELCTEADLRAEKEVAS